MSGPERNEKDHRHGLRQLPGLSPRAGLSWWGSPGALESCRVGKKWSPVLRAAVELEGRGGWEVRQGVWQGGLEPCLADGRGQFPTPPPAFGVAAKLITSLG